MLRTKPVSVGSRFAAVVAFAVVIVGCDSSADPATTTVEVLPPTETVESTKPAAPTTVAPTTVSPTTTEATVPPTTSVEDGIREAMFRAQTAMMNCYKAGDNCDESELQAALVGVQLEGFRRVAAAATYENVDARTWTILEGPTLVGDELAVVEVCTFDPMVVTYPDGRVNDEEYYFRQEWQMLPVGSTWKLAQIINKNEATTDSSVCDA